MTLDEVQSVAVAKALFLVFAAGILSGLLIGFLFGFAVAGWFT